MLSGAKTLYTTEPVLVLLGPIFDLCIRLNSENHLTDFLGHVQRFCEQLITVVASLRARIQYVPILPLYC